MQIEVVSIIGSKGGMGSFFSRELRSAGLEVRELDQPLENEVLQEALSGSDLVLLAVPTEAVALVLERIEDYLLPPTILADICSVKVRPVKQMLEQYPGPVVGTHPLFGPQPDAQTALRTAVVSGRDEESRELVHELLTRIGQTPFATSAEEHDRCMAFIQGLNFVTSASYIAATTQEPAIENFLTPSFSRRLSAAQKMLTQDAELFEGLFEANPFSHEAVRQFRSYLNLAAAGELELLVEKAAWWWSEQKQGGGT
jgi:prephenate dehydrogenase